MKSKIKIISVFTSLISLTYAVGGVFASYTISDTAQSVGNRISLQIPNREVYLKTGVWETSQPVYFAHCYDGGEDYDVQLDKCDSDGYYKFSVSYSFKKVVFVRMPTNSVSLDWSTRWNQSEDLSFDFEKDTYEITGWGSDSISTGSWINHVCDYLEEESTIVEATGTTCAEKKITTFCGICGEIENETTYIDHSNIINHAAKAATCLESGNIHYYSCEHCGDYFEDENGIAKIEDKSSVVISETGHSFTNNYAFDATNHWLICDNACGEISGIEAHNFVDGYCSICGAEQGHVHDYVEHAAKSPSCTEQGNEKYYTCTGCDLIFDESKTEIGSIPVLAATGHTKVTHNAVDATCTTTGNSAYYECSVCGKYYSDAAMTNEIANGSWVTSSLDHDYGTDHYCTICGNLDPDYVYVNFKIQKEANGGTVYVVHTPYNDNDFSHQEWTAMSWTIDNWWVVKMVAPKNATMKFKFVCSYGPGNDSWEGGSDRTFSFSQSYDEYNFYWQ